MLKRDEATNDRPTPSEDSTQPKTMTPARAGQYWWKQLETAEAEQGNFVTEGKAVIEAYRNGKHNGGVGQKRRRYNVLYSNVETLRGAIYAKSGKPDIRQKWPTRDPLARAMSDILERSISSSIDQRSYEVQHEAAVLLTCLVGRAIMRFDVVPEVEEVPVPLAQGMGGHNGGPPLTMPKVVGQKVERTLIALNDFRHSPAENWQSVWWVAFRHKMTRDDMRDAKFRDAETVPLSWIPDDGTGKPVEKADDDIARAEVFEVWSKVHRKRYWIIKDHAAQRIDDDPLHLTGFWPMQEPLMFAPSVAGTMLPQLDWWQYCKLADDIEEANNRIAALTRQLKWRGVRDKSIKELEKLASAPDNTFVPVENYQQFVQKGGLDQAFMAMPIKELAETLLRTIEAAAQLEEKVDRMTGMADIMRGDSSGQAKTATEQNIKAQYGGIRLKLRQRAVQAWIRDGMRIEAELIAEHFEPDVLTEMTGVEIDDELLQALRSDKARGFRIEVETDSTIFEDDQAQKEANSQVIDTAVNLMTTGMQVAQAGEPELGEVVFEMLAMTLRNLKGGRQVEDVIDKARDQRQQRLQAQAQQPQQPSPEEIKAKTEAESAQMHAELEAQAGEREMQRDQIKHVNEMKKMQGQAELTQIKTAAAIQTARAKAAAKPVVNGAAH